MSFGFGIGDIIAVAKIADKVRRRFLDAPDQFRAVSDEVKGLSNVLRDIEDVFPERSLTTRQEMSLHENLQGCRNVLTALDEILDKYHDLGDAGGRSRNVLASKSRRFWKRLTFEPDDVRDIRLRMTSNVGLLEAFMGRLTLGLSYATNAGVDRLNALQDDERFLAIIDWLCDTNFPAQQSDLFKKCQEGTGQWLLESKEYKSWVEGREPILFCPGIPGAGKTFITSIVINDLEESFGQDPNIGIAYLFFNYKRISEQTIDNLLASLLKQLIQRQPHLPSEIGDLYELHKHKGPRPTFRELSQALEDTARTFRRVFFIVDALDECTDSRLRTQLTKYITTVQAREHFSTFATSRFLPEVLSEFHGSMSVEIRATDGDVRRYLEGHMTELPLCVQRNPALQETIVTEITKAADGMFLLAQLHLGSLSGKTTTKSVKTTLQNLPKGSKALDTAYREALNRIETQKSEFQQLAKRVLYWVVCAMRQLSVPELQCALAVETGSRELDEDNLPEPDEMISICAGLVTVDEHHNTIRLVHYTTQECFERSLPEWAPHAKAEITQTCLDYLSMDTFVDIPWIHNPLYEQEKRVYDENFQKLQHHHHLLSYAAQHWYLHAESCWSEVVKTMVLSFLSQERKYHWKFKSTRLNELVAWDDKDVNFVLGPRYSEAMHFASYFGTIHIALALLEAGHDPQAEDSDGLTPLSYAVINEQQVLVEWLLNLEGTDPNHVDNFKNFPLLYAVPGLSCLSDGTLHLRGRFLSNASTAISKLLLQRNDILVNMKNSYGTSALARASEVRVEGAVTLLVERADIEVNSYDRNGRTPLMRAIDALNRESGRVAEFLLERADTEVNCKDSNDRTALMLAAYAGRTHVVELLLARDDIDIRFRDREGRTALMMAACVGHEDVVVLLLARDNVEIDSSDNRGRRALMLAAGNGAAHVVDSLLARHEIAVNHKDTQGRTALMLAVLNGKTPVVKILLACKDVDINYPDINKTTPLMLAASLGMVTTVKLLLNRDDIGVNFKDIRNRTASMLAVSKGNPKSKLMVMKHLLARKDVDINYKDEEHRTALIRAACNGGGGNMLGVLLTHDDIAVDCKDLRNRTALMWAVSFQDLTATKHLLKRKDVDINCRDENSNTALMLAYEAHSKPVVGLLEQSGALGELPEAGSRNYDVEIPHDHWSDDSDSSDFVSDSSDSFASTDNE